MSLLLCQREIEGTKVVLLRLHNPIPTSLATTELLSSILASWVRQRVELTIVAE